jgi:hypothetical protein
MERVVRMGKPKRVGKRATVNWRQVNNVYRDCRPWHVRASLKKARMSSQTEDFRMRVKLQKELNLAEL